MCFVTCPVAEKYRRPHLSRRFPPNCAVSGRSSCCIAQILHLLLGPVPSLGQLQHLLVPLSGWLSISCAWWNSVLLVRFDFAFGLGLPTNMSKWHSLQARRNGVGLRKGTLGHAWACAPGKNSLRLRSRCEMALALLNQPCYLPFKPESAIEGACMR